MLVSLDEHLSELKRLVSETDDFNIWASVYEWLLIASSIDSMEIDTMKDYSPFACNHAYEYDSARNELLQVSILRLTIFNYIWGALEASIDIIKPPKQPGQKRKEKIRDTCFLLKNNFTSHSQLIGLDEEVKLFREAALQCFGLAKVETRLSKLMEFGSSGVGLNAVYELRNLFAHGSLSFPQPDDFNRPISPFNEVVDHASRILLMSIQMLMLYHFDYEFYEVWHNGDTVQLKTVLYGCHLFQHENDEQLSLI